MINKQNNTYKDIIITVLWSKMDNDTLSLRLDFPEGFAFHDYDSITAKLDDGEEIAIKEKTYSLSSQGISNDNHNVIFNFTYNNGSFTKEIKIRSWYSDSPKPPKDIRSRKHAGMKDIIEDQVIE